MSDHPQLRLEHISSIRCIIKTQQVTRLASIERRYALSVKGSAPTKRQGESPQGGL
jgi:hypothetical protein